MEDQQTLQETQNIDNEYLIIEKDHELLENDNDHTEVINESDDDDKSDNDHNGGN